MEQKFIIKSDNKTKKLIIEEFSKITKGKYEIVYKKKYDIKIIKQAIKKGKAFVIEKLRSEKFFLTREVLKLIIPAIIQMKKTDEKIIIFDEKETIKEKIEIDEEKIDAEIIDSEDDINESNDENDEISSILKDDNKISLKVSNDEQDELSDIETD